MGKRHTTHKQTAYYDQGKKLAKQLVNFGIKWANFDKYVGGKTGMSM